MEQTPGPNLLRDSSWWGCLGDITGLQTLMAILASVCSPVGPKSLASCLQVTPLTRLLALSAGPDSPQGCGW